MANIKLNTRFGELNIDSSKVITFPKGIPGFEANTRWTLFHELDDKGEQINGVVTHLQSMDDGLISLPLTNPNLFGFNYELVLTNEEVDELKLEEPGDLLVLVTLSDKTHIEKTSEELPTAEMFANISAPILINVKSHIGMQKILSGQHAKVDFRTKIVL